VLSGGSVNKSAVLALVSVIVLFGALTVAALLEYGVWGILAPHLQSLAGGQVFADLVVAIVLIQFWIVQDARARGKNPLPWIVLSLLAGSFGPLLYLLERELAGSRLRPA
jgi:hypothetical protein